MANSIHISVARKIIESGDPFDVAFWSKDGKIQHWRNCVGLRYSVVEGTRQLKLLDSRQIRTIRDVCVFMINGMQVFL